MDKKYFIDLFAGCGGLSLGLEQSGFTPVFVNELNHDAMDTYLKNRLDSFPWLEDNNIHNIKDLTSNAEYIEKLKNQLLNDFNISDIDLIAGGPPCQGYSGIGHRRSYSVDKSQLPSNHLYKDMVYFIGKIKPKMFLFENVRGLLSARWSKNGKKGEIWNDVLSEFRTLKNYHIEWKLVYAKEYGVPQNRPRVLMVGVRNDVCKSINSKDIDSFLPKPTFNYPTIEEVLDDLIDDNYTDNFITDVYKKPAQNKWQRYYRKDKHLSKIHPKGSVVTDHEYSRHSKLTVAKFDHMINNNGQIPEPMKTKKFAQKVLPKNWGDNGPNITVTSAPDDNVHYSQPRSLTVREWARLQTFPDWYEFCGKRTTGGLRRAGNPREGIHDRELPKYTQIGNAVPVKMAHAIGSHFIKLLT